MGLPELKHYFLPNKYTRWYLAIITRAQNAGRNRGQGVYYERHHVLPKGIWPEFKLLKDYPWNGALLTFKEHFLAHWLLTKMVSEPSARSAMSWCFNGLIRKNSKHGRVLSSAQFVVLKTQFSRANVGRVNPMLGKTGELSPHFGRIQTLEHKEKRLKQVRGRRQREESRALMKAHHKRIAKGKLWYNNTQSESYFFLGAQPEGWVRGRVSRAH